jgi:hypothetical protein
VEKLKELSRTLEQCDHILAGRCVVKEMMPVMLIEISGLLRAGVRLPANIRDKYWKAVERSLDAYLSETTEHGSAGQPDPKTDAHGELKKLDFENAGQLYAAAWKHFKVRKTQVDKDGGISRFDLTVKAQRKLAWLTIIDLYGRDKEN